MSKFLYVIIAIATLASCSEYQKALKSEDVKVKYELAERLYNEKKFKKSSRLFEQIVPKYRGKPQGERVTFLYARTLFEIEQYIVSGYQFERFVRSYPKSDSIQVASFYEAKSYYMQSPRFSIDQRDTYTAINKLQGFINNYPESEYLDNANEMVDELTTKIEKKAYEIAKQYNTISDYKAAIKATENFLSDYPGTEFREDAMYLKLDAMYNLAIRSFETLMEERFNEAASAYKSLMKFYPESKYKEEADKIMASITEELAKFTK
ncbi:Beta-barrel assembly machine subunit BamD [Kordia periserrulae]|uniref:Beta-barrel assembly machine subunit BamD n=1 Tax=Kordia periserrulae TaxID=701523 RepID=A0A2T6BUK2_9FLAO|nr:outer membrane protein assembly factor BamD [Kordia periserrulae]PTX59734.1 Beta-barrel assembly machine subunit BamD [Kordia periserrulae]